MKATRDTPWVRAQLTRRVPVYPKGTRKVEFFFPHTKQGLVLVPRLFKCPQEEEEEEEEEEVSPLPKVPFLATLRPFQQSIFEKLSSSSSSSSCTLVLPCGHGKTVIALALCAHLNVPVAVLAHKLFLLDQWAERAEQMAPGMRVQKLGKKEEEEEPGHITLCSMQTLCKWPEVLHFGLVIVDEAHHIAADTFARAMSRLRAPHVLGLTATPRRKDKLEDMVYMLLGRPFVPAVPQLKTQVEVDQVLFPCPYRDPHFARLVTRLTTNRARNRLLVRLVEAMRRKERHGLLLSDRTAHLEELHKLIPGSKVVTGKSKDKSFGQFLTLSTYGLFSEAVDFSGDFLVLSTPRGDVEQCVGRILRGHCRMMRPVVIDLVDTGGPGVLSGLAKKRERYYQTQPSFCIKSIKL